MAIPAITGTTEIVTNSSKKIWESVTEKHSIASLKKDSYTGTSHIIWEVLQPKT